MINGMLRMLSKARPVRNRNKANVAKELAAAVAHDAINPIPTQSVRAGTRPLLSAIQPNKNPPTMEPQKNMACVVGTKNSLSHTQSS